MSYLRQAAIRSLQTVPVLFGVSVVVFAIIHSAPGDPLVNILGIQATQGNIQHLRHVYGLDRPLYVQYVYWLNGVLHGHLGRSLTRSQTVTSLIASRLPATLFLALVSMIIALLIALPTGILSALRRGTLTDYAVTTLALTGISIPNFWLGLFLILIFARVTHTLPPGDYVPPLQNPVGALRHVLLPAITVGTAFAALIARQTRSSLLDNLHSDSMRFARAKGLNARTRLIRHGMKESLLPVITVVGLQFGYLLSATVVVEQVFAWPGMGRLIWNAVTQQDYPTVQGAVLVVAAIFVLVNLVVDLTYSYLDPRVEAQ